MSKFHFFTDTDLLNSQTEQQTFGAKNADIFQVSSRHTADNAPKAYAVCKGKVLVQPDETNPALVNIILKPEEQSDTCPSVLYYIYRGILKSSLTNANSVLPNTDELANTLTKSINETVESPSTDILGLGLYNKPDFENTDRIENAFYIPRNDFELWTVGGGWCIGTFDKDNIGFEIMLDTMGFQPTFDLVRKGINEISVTAQTGFAHWHEKEEILNYIDPAAFYGNFYDEKIYARTSTDEIDKDSLMPEFDKKKEDELYLEVLSNFHNKNRIYIDIRNEMNYALDYFGNYGQNILLSHREDEEDPDAEPNEADELNYYGNSWPLCTLDLSSREKNTTELKIALPKGDNSLPLLYVWQGKLKQKIIDRIKYGKRKFMEMQTSEESNYTTNSIVIQIPNNEDEHLPICSYVRVKYLKRLNPEQEDQPAGEGAETVLRAVNKADFIFPVLDMELPFKGNENVKIKTYESDSYIDAEQEFGVDYIARTGIAEDQNNIILFAGLKERRMKSPFAAKGKSFSIVTGAYNTGMDFFQVAIDAPTQTKTVNAANDVTTTIFKFHNINTSLFSSQGIDFNTEMVCISFAKDEFEQIKTIAKNQFSSKYKVYLCLEKVPDESCSNHKLLLKSLVETNGEIAIHSVDVTINDEPLSIYDFLPKTL